MVTEQNGQQEIICLDKQKRRKRRRHRLIIRLFLGCLLLGVICFSIAKIAAGLLLTSDNGDATLDQHVSVPNEMPKGYIVLDPGHGGEGSPGCVYGGILERDVTLEISLLIRDALVQRGYTVMMTREKDETVTLEQRTEMANKSDADLFISIHLNAHEDDGVSGIETWFNPNTNTRSSALAGDVQQSIIASTKGKDRGTYSDASLILTREVLIPSCLVEAGYLSNDEEREKMTTEAYREKIAQGITDGVEQYFERFPRSQSQADDRGTTVSTTPGIDPSEHAVKKNSEEDKVVYLTFDDGPSSNTEKILDILDQYQIKANFFVTGLNKDYYCMIKEAYERGHTIGLHTYSHDYARIYTSEDAFFQDLDAIASIVKEQIGFVPKYIRFAGGTSNIVSKQYCVGIMTSLAQKVSEMGYQYYDWSAAAGDSLTDATVDTLVANATACDWNQLTLLCHDANGKQITVEALPEIIETYLQRGYHFEAISNDTTPVHHKPQN
ncbi:MAG: N-acetylmuramoyl-L-alanine amidase [Dehalobacterium sp.]